MTFHAKLILDWYDQHRRELPWRKLGEETPDPYHVLLSEVMLQQTQVATVIPYFNRFLSFFPTIHDLAQAELSEILTIWSGLGYYNRARNLHHCAQQISAAGGEFPQESTELKALPGIGNYTAAALLAIVFNQPIVPVDGNVERIVARLFNIADPLPKAKSQLAQKANTLNQGIEAQQRAGDFAQALFDIGATICRPKNPFCLLCPLSSCCIALEKGTVSLLPMRQPKIKKPVKYGSHFCLINQENKILLRKRPPSGILGETLELPGTSWRLHPWELSEALEHFSYQGDWKYVGEVKHIFTHFVLILKIYKIQFSSAQIRLKKDDKWYVYQDIHKHPFSTLMKKSTELALEFE